MIERQDHLQLEGRARSYPPRLALRLSIGCLAAILVILLLIRFVDAPAAYAVAEHLGWARSYFRILAITAGIPIVVLLLLCAAGSAMFRHFVPPTVGVTSRLASIGAVVAFVINDYGLKPVFGRADIQTWKVGGGNGFHFFHSGPGYTSFPSGHMAVAGAILVVIGMLQPAWRRVCVFAGIVVAIALVGAQWHFASDILAGFVVGFAVALSVVSASDALIRWRKQPPGGAATNNVAV